MRKGLVRRSRLFRRRPPDEIAAEAHRADYIWVREWIPVVIKRRESGESRTLTWLRSFPQMRKHPYFPGP